MKSVVVSILSLALLVGLGIYIFSSKGEHYPEQILNDKTPEVRQANKLDSSVKLLDIDSSKEIIGKVDSIPALAKKQMEAIKNKPDHRLETSKRDELQIQANQKQAEIDILIVSLNENLANPDKRKRIQVQIDDQIEQYNALILPLALEKMTARVN